MNISVEKLLKIRLAFGPGSLKGYDTFLKLSEGSPIPDGVKSKLDKVNDSEISDIINKSRDNGISIIPITSSDYPSVLRNISDPPLILFVKGSLPDFDLLPTITVVGPRKVSEFGEKAAYSLSMRLSKAGFTVVSGAALGADTASLKGALNGKGIPVGVLGCGICYDYLPENRSLRNKIAERGCLISEYPPFAQTSRFGFPIRNRIMSALSHATVVVEAGIKSGALITARNAIEQGKDVFVIPGNPTDEKYKGSNALLRDGAAPLLDASDVFNLFLPRFAEKIDIENAFRAKNETNSKKTLKKTISGLSNDANILYNNIINNKFTADDFLSTGISGERILSALTELEISGLIKSLPGGIYEVV